MGILRKAVVAGGLFAVLPMPPQSVAEMQADQQPAPGTFAYVAAASETYSDISAFCRRRPMACEVGQYIAETAQAKAKYSAKIIYEWANTGSSAATLPNVTMLGDATPIPVPVERPPTLLLPRAQKKS